MKEIKCPVCGFTYSSDIETCPMCAFLQSCKALCHHPVSAMDEALSKAFIQDIADPDDIPMEDVEFESSEQELFTINHK